jgi:hypothetical protein
LYLNVKNIHSVKIALQLKAQEILEIKMQDIDKQLAELQASAAGETKSSAGDKYETQREMMKQSRDLLDLQASRIAEMLIKLKKIPVTVVETIREGALVKLSTGFIWISIPLAKITLDNVDYQLISVESPLFSSLSDKKAGEESNFRGRKISVIDVE